MVDLLGSDDFVEDRGEGLVLADDVGGDQGGHDQLPLPDVGFHGNPGQGDTKTGQELGQTDTNHIQDRAGQQLAGLQRNVGFCKDSMGIFISSPAQNPFKVSH